MKHVLVLFAVVATVAVALIGMGASGVQSDFTGHEIIGNPAGGFGITVIIIISAVLAVYRIFRISVTEY